MQLLMITTIIPNRICPIDNQQVTVVPQFLY